MPTIIVITNAFKPHERDIFDASPATLLADEIAERYGDAVKVSEFIVSRNGEVLAPEIAESFVISPGDYISLVAKVGKGGGGKGGGGVLGIIAAIALLTMTMGGGGAALGGIFGGKMAMQLLVVGGLLMLLGKPPKVETPNMPQFSASSFDQDPTWDTGTPIAVQGRPIPITYGTVRVRSPQVLSQHISVGEDGKQTLNLLMSGGEGPVDTISDFFINDQPSDNYGAISLNERRQIISAEIPVTMDHWSTPIYFNAGTEKSIVTVEFPTGLYYKAPGGAISSAYVDIRIEHRVSGGPGAGWVWEDYATVRVAKAETMAARPKTELTYLHPDSEAREIRMRIETYSPNISGMLTVYTGAVSWTPSYESMFATRLGTNDQTVMDSFRDTFAEEVVGLELDDAWTEHQLSGDTSEGLEWTLDFPTGLAYYDDKGDASLTWVKINIDYRLVGAPVWTSHKAEWKIEKSENSNFKVSTRVDGLTAGQYESRVQVAAVAGTGTRYVNTVRWQLMAGIVYDDFIRPNKILVGMTALATDKLQGGLPRVSWLQTRNHVKVWNPIGGGGSGAYENRSATNPAWICYDLIHRARSIRNINTGLDEIQVRGDAASKIDYAAFAAWASFCDETVAGAARCECHVLVDASGQLWEQVSRIATSGRGAIVLRGQVWSAIWDAASQPVQLFTGGNLQTDSLAGEFTSGQERANAVEVSFINSARNYERDSIVVYSDKFDESDTTDQPAQTIATGIVTAERAYREGAYRLRMNKYIRRICSWRADVDAIACQVGDVVLLSHDLPRWGEGGRILSVNDAGDEIVLDREVVMTIGEDYQVIVRLSDDTLVTKIVVNPDDETPTNTITLAAAFAQLPDPLNIYAFGKINVAAKPFRVTKMARTGDAHIEITAVEYYPEIYDENVTVPTIDYSTTPATISNVYGNVEFDATGKASLAISWNTPRDSYGGATVLVNGFLAGRVGPTETSIKYPIAEDGAYQVTVIGYSTAGVQLDKVQTTITVAALTIPIPESIVPVEDTYIKRDGTVVTDIDVTFTIPDEGEWFPGASRRYPVQRFAAVRVSYQANGAGDFISAGNVTSRTSLRISGVKAATSIIVKLEVLDKFGNAGAAGYSDELELTGKSALPQDVTGFAGAQDQYGIALGWSMTTDPDIDVYEIREGASWDDGAVVFRGYAARHRLNFSGSGTFNYHIKAKDTSGNYSTNATSIAVEVDAPTQPVVAATPINGGVKVDITHTPSIDFDHFEVIRTPSGGGDPVVINSNLRSTTWMDTDIVTLGYVQEWVYSVIAHDRNSAISPASVTTDAVKAKRIESLDITTDQIVAKDIRSATNAGDGAVSGYRIHSGGIEGWNGATKNFCLDGATGTLYAVNACLTGTICATAGVIGGWTVNAGSLTAGNAALCCTGVGVFGTGNDVAVVSAADADYRFWTGHATPASAPFSITKAGAIAATSGTVGGWTLGAGVLCSASGCAVFCCTGLLTGGGYASGASGWQIASDGSAEFNTLTARGAFRASVFQYQEVAAVGGQLLVANAGIVRTAVTTPAGTGSCFTLDVVDPEVGHAAQFAADDILRVQTWNGSALISAWGTVTAVSDQTTFYRYTVRLESGTSQAIPARAAVVSYGTAAAGGGIINVGAGTCSPYIDVFSTGAAPWTSITPQVRLGNLSGIAGLSGYGLYTNNGNIYGGVVRSNTFDCTSGSCFGLAAGLLQLGGCCGGVSKAGLYWNGTCLNVWGGMYSTYGCIGGFVYDDRCFCAACFVCYAGGCCSSIILDSANGEVKSYLGRHQLLYMIGSPSLIIFTCCSGSGIAFFPYGGGSACTWVGCTCMHSPVICGTTCAVTPVLLASTCVCSPVVIGSTCVRGAYIYGAGNIYSCTCVCAPVICGTTSAASPILCGTTCVRSPIVFGTIVCGATCASSPFVFVNKSRSLLPETAKGIVIYSQQADVVNDCRLVGIALGFSCGTSISEKQVGIYARSEVTYSNNVAMDFYSRGNDAPYYNRRAIMNAAGNWTFGPNDCASTSFKVYIAGPSYMGGNAYSCTCFCSPVFCGTTCISTPVLLGSTCVRSPILHATTCIASGAIVGYCCSTSYVIYARNDCATGYALCTLGGNVMISLGSTSNAFTVCNVTTGSGTAAHILASGQIVCQSSTRASKCCIAPWCLPSYFLDCFEPIRFLYCSGLNSGAPYLVGALADDMASWAPEFVRCDDAGKPVSLHEGGLAIAALSGLKVECGERKSLEARVACLERQLATLLL